MSNEVSDILIHLLISMVAGGLIGLERSYFGRPAGFRTHTLVCMASALLMLVTVYQKEWFGGAVETVRVDPTRMAQGIMTGIGFLGAGVIMKEGASIRGLTTAASIWITAAIGILAGVGFYNAVFLVTVLTLSTLTLYRVIERKIPMLIYVKHHLRFRRENCLTERDVQEIMKANGFSISDVGYAVTSDGQFVEYDLVIKTRHEHNIKRLAETLSNIECVKEFRISPTGD